MTSFLPWEFTFPGVLQPRAFQHCLCTHSEHVRSYSLISLQECTPNTPSFCETGEKNENVTPFCPDTQLHEFSSPTGDLSTTEALLPDTNLGDHNHFPPRGGGGGDLRVHG
ncbi:hypothetical protein MLD38_018790 [Melastoma candidum]|uniref:Uncharacterized protein n=1 Tax=Melastoma candidum TaxID=119954 RepID=A0ACB9QWT4_9MYRT|nr:hypothetical protein MLD38_018790 [Melastoma candidum]